MQIAMRIMLRDLLMIIDFLWYFIGCNKNPLKNTSRDKTKQKCFFSFFTENTISYRINILKGH